MGTMPPPPGGGGPTPGGGGGAPAFSGGAPRPPAAGGAPGGAPGGAGAGASNPSQAIVGVIKIAQQMEQMLLQFAQAMPDGAQDFKAAADALKQGLAKSLAAEQAKAGGGGAPGGGSPAAPTSSPTDSGVGYSGGSVGAGR